MTKKDIERVMSAIPSLTAFGLGIFQDTKMTVKERDAAFQEGRTDLLNSADACTRICDWLANVPKTARINNKRSSYGLKHVAEQEIGYITNGQFIAAAIHSGFRFKQAKPGSPNVCLNMNPVAKALAA